MDIPANDRILREPECKVKTGLGQTARWTMEQRGEFPKRVRLGARASGWLESEVNDWLAKRVRESRAGA